MYGFRFLLILGLLPLLFLGCRPPQPETVTIKVGSAWPLSGPQADYGKEGDRAVKLAFREADKDEVTAGGKKIRFQVISEDDSAPEKKNAARILVDREVTAVIGHPSANMAGQGAAVYRDALLPFIAPTGSFTGLTRQGFDNIFRLVANDNQQALALADYIADVLFLDRLVIITDQTVYGRGLAEAFENQSLQRGAKVLLRESLSTSAAQTDALLSKVKSLGPQLVFFGGVLPPGGELARALEDRGVKAVFMGADAIQSPVFPELAGDAAEGSYASRGSVPLEKMPGLAGLEKKLGKLDREPGGSPGPFAYDAARMLVQAVKNCGCVEPENISRALHELKDFSGVTGTLAFDSAGDLTDPKMTIYRVQQGKWVAVQR